MGSSRFGRAIPCTRRGSGIREHGCSGVASSAGTGGVGGVGENCMPVWFPIAGIFGRASAAIWLLLEALCFRVLNASDTAIASWIGKK